MEVLIYFLIFMMGAFMGSFASLAIYRIPIGQDIFIKHSYCPNCNAKLTILDLIPVFSYLLIGGKCRHCHKKIRIRYLLLEVLSGLAFLTFIISMKLDLMEITKLDLLTIIFGTIYIITLILIAGIDKERRNIQKSLLVFGFFISIIYTLFNCFIVKQFSLQFAYIILIVLETICILFIAKNKQPNYFLQILMLVALLTIITKPDLLLLTVAISIVSIILYTILQKSRNKSVNFDNYSLGYIVCIANICAIVIKNFYTNYIS